MMVKTSDPGDSGKRSRRWLQFRLRTLLAVVAAWAVVLGTVCHFRHHILWRLSEDRAYAIDVPSVPVEQMPPTRIPEDWAECRIGGVRISLPRDFIGSEVAQGGNIPRVEFRNTTTTVRIDLPNYFPNEYEHYRSAVAHLPERYALSRTRIREAMFRASAADFRWSMSIEELTWHKWILHQADMGTGLVDPDDHIETMYREDIEGLLFVLSAQFYWLEWSTTDGTIVGAIQVFSRSATVDPEFVRGLCGSLRFSGESFSEGMTDEEVAKLIEFPVR